MSYGNPGGREEEVAVVRAIYDAFERRDVEAALPFVAEDAEFFLGPTQTQIGRTEPYRGHAGLRQYFADAGETWEELALHAGEMRAAVGGVVVFGEVSARLDGVEVRRRAVWTWRVVHGKAVSLRVGDLGEAAGGA